MIMPENFYFDMNYGECVLEECNCRKKNIWLGIGCENWKPLNVSSFDELKEKIKERYSGYYKST